MPLDVAIAWARLARRSYPGGCAAGSIAVACGLRHAVGTHARTLRLRRWLVRARISRSAHGHASTCRVLAPGKRPTLTPTSASPARRKGDGRPCRRRRRKGGHGGKLIQQNFLLTVCQVASTVFCAVEYLHVQLSTSIILSISKQRLACMKHANRCRKMVPQGLGHAELCYLVVLCPAGNGMLSLRDG